MGLETFRNFEEKNYMGENVLELPETEIFLWPPVLQSNPHSENLTARLDFDYKKELHPCLHPLP
jgi:hypothetical protein